jgi:hypothetical protein
LVRCLHRLDCRGLSTRGQHLLAPVTTLEENPNKPACTTLQRRRQPTARGTPGNLSAGSAALWRLELAHVLALSRWCQRGLAIAQIEPSLISSSDFPLHFTACARNGLQSALLRSPCWFEFALSREACRCQARGRGAVRRSLRNIRCRWFTIELQHCMLKVMLAKQLMRICRCALLKQALHSLRITEQSLDKQAQFLIC